MKSKKLIDTILKFATAGGGSRGGGTKGGPTTKENEGASKKPPRGRDREEPSIVRIGPSKREITSEISCQPE